MYNRVITINSEEEAQDILIQIGCSSQGALVMAPKAVGRAVLLYNVEIGAANILKQECLIIGADIAMSKGIVNGTKEESNMLFMGDATKLKALITRMRHYTSMGLPEIRNQLETFRKQMLYRSLDNKGIDFEPQIMGILNITPDSFSDGNEHYQLNDALAHSEKLLNDGATIIDIGGESTRPGSPRVSLEEELKRVIPVVSALHKKHPEVEISIDTYKSEVAKEAVKNGATLINDIQGLSDPKMIDVLVENPDVRVCIMHMQGTPETMQQSPNYGNVINEIFEFFLEKIAYCEKHGIDKSRIILDPGIGFGKRQEDNLAILKRMNEFHLLGCKILLGASRKSFIGKIYDSEPQDREAGTLATTAMAFIKGIDIVRVHNVKENSRLIKTLKAVKTQRFEI